MKDHNSDLVKIFFSLFLGCNEKNKIKYFVKPKCLYWKGLELGETFESAYALSVEIFLLGEYALSGQKKFFFWRSRRGRTERCTVVFYLIYRFAL